MRLLGVKDADLLISGSRRDDDIRVHFSRVPTNGSVAHEITSIESQVGTTSHGPVQFSGLQAVVGRTHRFGDAAWQLARVLNGHLILSAHVVDTLAGTSQFRAGVRMCCVDHHQLSRDPRRLLDFRPGLIRDFACHADNVQCHKSRALAIPFDDNRSSVERIQHALGATLVIVTGHRCAQRRSDIHPRDSHTRLGSGRAD